MMEAQQAPLRLQSFHISGLFGEFNHTIRLNCASRVTALIGPNGLGKTACLRLIDALFRKKWSVFSSTQFENLQFVFSDKKVLDVRRLGQADATTEVSDSLGVLFTLKDIDGADIDRWSPRVIEESESRSARLEHVLPYISRSGPRLWSHDITGQTYSYQELVEAFADQLPPSMISSIKSTPTDKISEIIDQIDCHLIETQRLFVFNSSSLKAGGPSTLAISQKAQVLKNVIARELAVYAATSQSLDRTFPKRVLQHGPTTPTDEISVRLTQLDATRRGLTEAGILEPEADDALPNITTLDSAIASVLSIYIDDTNQKLKVLETLRAKILLFIELIDKRFAPKYIEVDKKSGFLVRRSETYGVPLEKLSSGEQHQLVLFFELLFELKDNALILIDEPELSLHVGWQKIFIADLMRIISLNCFDVILATHSPQLIGEWEDLVVELGDVDPE